MRMVFALCEELGTSADTITRVARQLGYGVESVHKWVDRAKIDAGTWAGLTSAESEELKRLHQENREHRAVGHHSTRRNCHSRRYGGLGVCNSERKTTWRQSSDLPGVNCYAQS